MRRTAVIDMGSNSWRLVVYDWEPGGPWALSDEIREAVRVGAGMGEEGALQPAPMDRAVHTAAVFAAFCRASGVDDVVAVATSAIRDAENGRELLDRIRAHTGLDPRVISGEEEARYGYLAIVNSTTLRDGLGIDVGGGSVQLVRVEGRMLREAASVPLGAVRVSEAFLPGEEASGRALKALRRHVRELLGELEWLGEGPRRLAGIGGTVRNLAAAAQKRAGIGDAIEQGFLLTDAALDELVEELASRPASKRGSVPGIKPDRGDVILGGAVMLRTAMDVLAVDGLEVTEAGLREGIFFERYLAPADPPLLEDVRRHSVLNLSSRFHAEPEHVRHVARLSLQIYDGLDTAGLHRADPEERQLLWAACMLHDVGVAIDYDDHHKHSRYLILSSGLPGWTPREVALVAAVARYHRKGDPDVEVLDGLAGEGDAGRLELLSGIIRLAEQLERSRDQSVRSVRVVSRDGQLRLESEAEGDVSVPLWAASRSADLLARAVGVEVDIAPLQEPVH